MLFSTGLRATARTSAISSAARSFSTTPRASLARMNIIGRLAAEPELVNTSTGKEMVRYTLGVNFGPKDNRQTSWFRVANFDDEGPRRDFLLSLSKGTLMHVDAEARMNTYEDDEGKKHSSLNLVQRSIEILSRPQPRELAEDGQAAAAGSA